MGISFFSAELILREHKFRPLPRTVHLLGRQTVQLTPEQIFDMLDRHGIRPASVPVEIDEVTSYARASGQDYISDTTFFGMLGVENIRAIDHSDFEGADIILDLNEPLPADLAGTADFVIGGSVLDNVFDPAAYIKNIARLMAPRGRFIDQNIGSFHYHPYVIAAPAWYFDYFVLNAFNDCKLYFLQANAVSHVYGLEIGPDDVMISDLGSAGVARPFGINIVAEKGDNSSWDQVPSQDQYRNACEWEKYRGGLRQIRRCAREYGLFGTPTGMDLLRVPLRWSKSFRYLGTLKAPNDNSFNGIIPQPQQTGLKIIEASYGLNLMGKGISRAGVVPLCEGNVTEAISEQLNGRDGATMDIDVANLGDPAPGLAKELRVRYTYLEDPEMRVHEIHIPAEAHGQQLRIPARLGSVRTH